MGTVRKVGAATNARFLAALGEGAPGLPDPATLESVVLPTVHDGQRAPGLRFGEPRVMALLASVASFAHVVGGLTNPGLCRHMVELCDPPVCQAERDEGSRADGLSTAERAEMARLRKELREAREERDILKRAVAFFAFL